MQNFREIIKEAEKSTLIFNLDMGRVPLINQGTIGVKATTALTSMAAVAEGRSPSNPSNESVALIDDVLSVAESISFFGSGTRSVTGKGALSGSYCTVPVCYTFKDKDTRFRAEQALRNRCKVSCATPYPPAVRDCIKAAIAAGKVVRPDDFVRVQVDLPKLGLKLAWKPRGDSEWIPHDHIIPFPPAVIENPSRTNGGKVELANLPAASLDDTLHNTSGSSYLSAASSDGSSTPNSVIARSPSGLTLTSGK